MTLQVQYDMNTNYTYNYTVLWGTIYDVHNT